MYKNYGDVNFFDYGVLVQCNKNNENEYDIIKCNPDCDTENNYLLTMDCIDITDSWIDKHDVCSYIGLRDFSIDYTEEEKILFAIGAIDYYGTQNSDGGAWNTKNEIIDKLENYEIDCDFYMSNFTDNNRNCTIEICYHTGSRVKITKDEMEDCIEYFIEYMEKGDSFTIIEM